ncbi:hypothetical protein Tco_0844634 [Tanacetum coccineum]
MRTYLVLKMYYSTGQGWSIVLIWRKFILTDPIVVLTEPKLELTGKKKVLIREKIKELYEKNEGTEENFEGTEEHIEGTEEQVESTDGHKKDEEFDHILVLPEDERLIKRMNEKGVDSSKDEMYQGGETDFKDEILKFFTEYFVGDLYGFLFNPDDKDYFEFHS